MVLPCWRIRGVDRFVTFSNLLCCADSQVGKGEQTRDISWWPKVHTWEGSGIDVGCWTPMCEQWFQKRLQSIKSGEGRVFSSKVWSKNLKYAKQKQGFYTGAKKIGEDFIINNCMVLPL